MIGRRNCYGPGDNEPYNHTTSNLAIYSHETSQDKLTEA